MKDAPWFARFATRISHLAGHPATFGVAAGAMVVWAMIGPFAGFSDVWQLTVNTGTTIVTFLMVFLIQNTQNRDSAAVQIKLDELIRATELAHNWMLDLEEHSEDDLRQIRKEYCQLAAKARAERDRERENRMET
jgi:low affinity Fe/Cu permease